jgi:alkylation response protein AidB-like acyl-CoA dehydrogenase
MREGFMAGLYAGRFHWDVIAPFPEHDPADRRAGDAVLADLRRLLRERVDPHAVDACGRLPDGLLAALRAGGYLGLRVDPALGGLGLSLANAFRAVETAASWSTPVGWCLAIQNGLGAGAYLPLLPPGPLRDLVARHVAEGAVLGDADSEPTGAASVSRRTTATPTADGAAYVIDGEKICIGNGALADLLVVSATVREDGRDEVRTFFVDTRTPGFRVRSAQEFLGLKGAPIAALTFDGVRVPREQMLVPDDDQDMEIGLLGHRARLLIIAAPSLAFARLCVHWSREFVNRREIDGRPLGSYDEIRRVMAANLADAFAIESVVEWSLLGESRESAVDLRLAQRAAKNITSVACGRVLDRTVGLLAAEGFETARSKAARGAQPLPLERLVRDGRGLRVAGGVEFLLDKWLGERELLPRPGREAGPNGQAAVEPDEPALPERNRAHLRFVAAQVRALPGACREAAGSGEPPPPDRVPILLNRVASELFTMSVTLARAASLAPEAQDLADVYCSAARHRLADWSRQLADRDEPDYGRAAEAWLRDGRPDLALRDVITDVAPVG